MWFACGLILLALFSLCAAGLQTDAPADRDPLQAIEAARRLLRETPDSEGNRLSLAALYLKAGRNQDAVQILQEYLQSHPNSRKALRVLAVAYLRKEDYSPASDTAERALRVGPRDSAGIQVLAMAKLGLQETALAERLLLEALQLDPNSVEADFQLGLLYTRQHRNLPEAIRLLEKARTLQPNLAGINTALGSAFLGSGNARQAASSLETAVQLAPNDTEAYYLLASAYRQLQNEDKAEAALTAFNASKKAEADRRARQMRSQADYQEGVDLLSNSDQLDKAYAALAKAANELPTFDPAYYRMLRSTQRCPG